MTQNEVRVNFWTTLPGILTGLAAILTAAGGIFSITMTSQHPTSINPPITTPASSSSPHKYQYTSEGQTNFFVNTSGKVWNEERANGEIFNTFTEIDRNSNFISLHDNSRDMTLKLPINGGYILITWKDKQWVERKFYFVNPI